MPFSFLLIMFGISFIISAVLASLLINALKLLSVLLFGCTKSPSTSSIPARIDLASFTTSAFCAFLIIPIFLASEFICISNSPSSVAVTSSASFSAATFFKYLVIAPFSALIMFANCFIPPLNLFIARTYVPSPAFSTWSFNLAISYTSFLALCKSFLAFLMSTKYSLCNPSSTLCFDLILLL